MCSSILPRAAKGFATGTNTSWQDAGTRAPRQRAYLSPRRRRMTCEEVPLSAWAAATSISSGKSRRISRETTCSLGTPSVSVVGCRLFVVGKEHQKAVLAFFLGPGGPFSRGFSHRKIRKKLCYQLPATSYQFISGLTSIGTSSTPSVSINVSFV